MASRTAPDTTTEPEAPEASGLAAEAAALLAKRQKDRTARAAAQRSTLTLEGRLLAGFLEDRYHAVNCPGSKEPDTARVEGYGAVRPATETRPASKVTVVRCVDCGGSRYQDGVPDAEALIDVLLAEAAGAPAPAAGPLDEVL